MQTLTGVELLTAYADFLTVSTHTIIYDRGIYPAESFLLARKYNFPVRQSRHPQVCDWIRNAVFACLDQMKLGEVRKVSIVILSNADAALERFVFDINSFPKVAVEDTRFQMNIKDMEEQFRSCIMKLSQISTTLGKLPPGCTFTMIVELDKDAKAPQGPESPWIASNDQPQDEHQRTALDLSKPPKLWPLRNIEIGPAAFDVWVEESWAKEKMACRR
ncbi:DNA-binding protein [Lipomyces arxii]|uniref:DNA-binding protein n=1 Tax=Lipomyces arxii TaxID=56418 RepID=UPI0034CE411E